MENEDECVTTVRVAVRCRPQSSKELSEGQTIITEFPSGSQVKLAAKGDANKFEFDHVFSPATTQDYVYECLGEPLLVKAFDGFNSTVFAYGQTGSGKTHTMMNHLGSKDQRGLIPRISDGLFQRIDELSREHEHRKFLVQCSFLEIYNEVLYDLLVPRSKQTSKGGLEIKEQKGIGVFVQGLSEVVIETSAKLNKLIEDGFEQRSTGATKMNDVSSRSHCIFMIKLHQKDVTDESKNTFSKVNLVDLAGSERAKSTEASGDRLKEGANINKSLSALGNVINALSSMAGSKKGSVFVPYRNSKLTRVLQESLGGNSLCTMMAAISPSSANADETLSTLNYAKRAKTIKVTATKNEEANQIRQLQDEVEALKRKLEGQAAGSMGSSERTELVGKYEGQIEELQAFMKQSWEDKQKLSEMHEIEQKKAAEEARKAAEKAASERKRRLELLEKTGDIQLSIQSLQALNSSVGSNLREKFAETLRVDQQMRSQLRAVHLYHKSAATDFETWWERRSGDPLAVLTLVGQVDIKLKSMSKELGILEKLESQLELEIGQITPSVAVALREAKKDMNSGNASDSAEELVEVLGLLQRQLSQHQAKVRAFQQTERQQLILSQEFKQLQQFIEEQGSSGALLDKMRNFKPDAAPGSARKGESSVVLGLSTLDVADSCLSASSNTEVAHNARLLQAIGYGGWCPAQDSADEYLEIDLGRQCQVSGISVQGRIPCSGEWTQTRDLLEHALDGQPLPSAERLSKEEKYFKRPPVRFIHDVGVVLAHRLKCFPGWEVPSQLLSYGDLSREQKVEFFEELITKTNEAFAPESGWRDFRSLTVTPLDFLKGNNCGETNRFLQLLAYQTLRLKYSGGLVDLQPQWTTEFNLSYFSEGKEWEWYGAKDGSNATLLEGNTDAESTRFLNISGCIEASKVRVHPIKWHAHPALRCELHVAADGGSAAAGNNESVDSVPNVNISGCLALLSEGMEEVHKGLEERQNEKLAEEQTKRASITEMKDKAEQERDHLEKRLQEALARVADLEGQCQGSQQKSTEFETTVLQMTIERDRLLETNKALEEDLAARSEALHSAEHQNADLQQECADLKANVEDLNAQLDVVTEERDVARNAELEAFDTIMAKEEELMDTNDGYVYLTERLQEKEEEMDHQTEQMDKLQNSNDHMMERCNELSTEASQLRQERQQLKVKLAEEERMHKAAQDRYLRLVKEGIGGTPGTAAGSRQGSARNPNGELPYNPTSRPHSGSTTPSTKTPTPSKQEQVHTAPPMTREASEEKDAYEDDFDEDD